MTTVHFAFRIPAQLTAKADPALIERDDEHLREVASALQAESDAIAERLASLRRASERFGQAALERDLEIHRLSRRSRLLDRFGIDLCLGRMVRAGEAEPEYVGRIGLVGSDGRRLLVDWRASAAEPYFAATHANPQSLVSRRRYRWTDGWISDYWDEVFDASGWEGNAALDDHSAFIASLGSQRSPRMRDVLSTIHADQDAIIRADSRLPLVVDGGPGTGKTVVALHRAAYLLHTRPHLEAGGGGVLVVGPHQPYLDYVSDVLPSLGEDGVRACTLRQLVPESLSAVPETNVDVARVKGTMPLVAAIGRAVEMYRRPPERASRVATPWSDVSVSAHDWADVFASAEPGVPHNEAREQVWEQLVDLVAERIDGESAAEVRTTVEGSDTLVRAFDRAWPVLDPAGIVAAMWKNPGFLAACAPTLSRSDIESLQREDGRAWTEADLPLLDAARELTGDPHWSSRRAQRAADEADERAYRADVAENLMGADDGEGLVTMLRGEDLQNSLTMEYDRDLGAVNPWDGPFGHIVIDEAQELTDAEWRMIVRRCPSRSLTIAGDRAQARHGFNGSWEERLASVGIRGTSVESLTVNYRTPEEIMREAELVIRAVLPDANVPTSVRSAGHPVERRARSARDTIIASWLANSDDAIACVIGDPTFTALPRVRSLPPEHAKGLEFDLVLLVDSPCFGDGREGAVDRYVAMTRATRQLIILE